MKDRLVSGEVTPLMQVSISARNGDVITLPLKLQMTADKNGNPVLMAYPVRAALEAERSGILRLTEQEAARSIVVKSSKKPWKSTARRHGSISSLIPKRSPSYTDG